MNKKIPILTERYMLRFASSPTGDMHIGELRIAILNYLIAQQRKEPLLIRIDDSEKARNIEGKDTEIMQILEKFALLHERVFHQSEHLHMHQTLAIKLLEEKKAFICTCTLQNQAQCRTKECLEKAYNVAKMKEKKTPFVVRFKAEDTPMLLKEDGTPTPLLASACDDILSGTTYLIQEQRAQQQNKQECAIQQALGYEVPIERLYVATLVDEKKSAMSRENPSHLVKSLFEQGFIPDAIINYLLLLSLKTAPQEIFTLPEVVKWFSLGALKSDETTPFSLEALRNINRAHLKRMDDKQLSTLFGFADADVGKLLKLYLNEASTINELALKIRPIFAPKIFKEPYEKEMRMLQSIIEEAPMIVSFEAFKKMLLKKSGLTDAQIKTPLRLLLTGEEHGPALSDIYPLINPYLLEVISS